MSRKMSEERTAQLREFEQKLGYTWQDLALLDTALTHSSYANEKGPGNKYNERLEFLGDSVLGFIAADWFFENFKDVPEGKLTKMRAASVCEEACYGFAKELDLGQYMLLGKGELKSGGRERVSILADAFEAVIGAIYLDGVEVRTRLHYEGCRAPRNYLQGLHDQAAGNYPEEPGGTADLRAGRPVRTGPRQAVRSGGPLKLQCHRARRRPLQEACGAGGRPRGAGPDGSFLRPPFTVQ